MAQKSLTERLHELEKATPSEKKIADFLLRNHSEIVFENATSISRKTAVSKATVVRFIARLGYLGFSDFQQQMRDDFVLKKGPTIERYTLSKRQKDGVENDFLGSNLTTIMENLQNLPAQVDTKTFMEVARILVDAQGSLYITGQRSSFALAHLFHGLMRRLRSRSILLGESADGIPDALVEVQAEDTLFAIFRYPYAKLTYKVANYFHDQGAHTIILTDSSFSPLNEIGDYQIIIPADESSLFRRFTAATAILESLAAAALHLSSDDVCRRFDINEKLFDNFETYCSRKTVASGEIKEFLEQRKSGNNNKIS